MNKKKFLIITALMIVVFILLSVAIPFLSNYWAGNDIDPSHLENIENRVLPVWDNSKKEYTINDTLYLKNKRDYENLSVNLYYYKDDEATVILGTKEILIEKVHSGKININTKIQLPEEPKNYIYFIWPKSAYLPWWDIFFI